MCCAAWLVFDQAAIDGEVLGSFDSYPGSVFNAFDIKGSDVHTLTLTSTGITQNEWISLIEVSLTMHATTNDFTLHPSRTGTFTKRELRVKSSRTSSACLVHYD